MTDKTAFGKHQASESVTLNEPLLTNKITEALSNQSKADLLNK